MSKRGISYIGLISIICFSCNSNNNNNYNDKKIVLANQYVGKEFKHYSQIYDLINDSINYYLDFRLKEYQFIYKYSWQIDSLVCFNSKQDKLVTAINVSYGIGNQSISDGVTCLLGKKINNKWYFFSGGGNLVVPRDMYGKDAMHPLSFYELSQIARKEMLAGAVITKNGKLIIDDKWVDRHFYNNGFAQRGWDEIKDRAKYDSVHWFYIMDKWKHKIDTNEYKPLQRKQHKKANV